MSEKLKEDSSDGLGVNHGKSMFWRADEEVEILLSYLSGDTEIIVVYEPEFQ